MDDSNSIAGKASPLGNLAANFSHAQLPTAVPPIGVFWDIENCQVPKGKSASALVQCIRTRYFAGHREAEFMCVCDIGKERKEVIKDLNLAQVTVVHVNATSKNAADDKLKQCMRRFVDIHGSPSTVLLISGDVNFATDLCDFRHRRNIRIILLHSVHAPQPLIACAHEAYNFAELAASLPRRSPVKREGSRYSQLIVNDLPTNRDYRQIQNRLCQLADNCGGKVKNIINGRAVLQFSSPDAARRAKKRMDKEDVFGSKISVLFPTRGLSRDPEGSPQRSGGSRTSRSIRYVEGTSDSSRDSSPMHNGSSDSAKAQTSTSSRNFHFPPPPDLISQNYAKHDNAKSVQTDLTEPSSNQTSGNFSDYFYDSSRDARSKSSQCGHESASGQSAESGRSRESSPYPHVDHSIGSSRYDRSLPRNMGKISPFLAGECSRLNYGGASSWTTASLSDEPQFRWLDNNTESTEPLSLGARAISSHIPQFPHFSSCHTSPVPFNVTQTLGRSLPNVGLSPNESATAANPVELQITNLDQNIEANEMKKILLSVFREHVMVLHVSMVLQPDGSLKAMVKVPSLQDAQYAISQLHRRKIGYKRILISYAATDRIPPLHVLKSEVIALISDIPTKRLPLFKFRELYEKRYHRGISISDLYRLRDAVIIQDDPMGRMISINPDFRNTPSPADSEDSQETLHALEKPYCEQHFHIIETQCWAERESVYPLPDIQISLKAFAPRVHTLLDTHQGSLPLNSFCACYEAEFGASLTAAPINDECDGSSPASGGCSSVPLEHLIACVPGVQITRSSLGIKKVQWLDNKSSEHELRVLNPALAGQLSLFSREMIDLLKNQPKCSMAFNKFIPAYHHHFGRQCRVADYGFTKLIDLLEAIPHVVQILGQGQKRVLTLTHHAQAKRFAADVLRVLKSRASKQIKLSELPSVYEQCIGRPFDIANYGVCDINDMMSEVSENTVVITHTEDDTVIAIPKREQTPEEIERTKQFAKEVVELLKHSPACSMAFNKFIPSYHHHFGRQCRLSEYGFSKLIELFEAMPEVVEVTGTGEEKVITLKEKERLQVLSEKMVAVLKAQPTQTIALSKLCSAYTHLHGYALRAEDYGAASIVDLIGKLKHSLMLMDSSSGPFVALVNKEHVRRVSLRVRSLLMEQPDGKMPLSELYTIYYERFGEQVDISMIEEDLESIVQLADDVLALSPLMLLARDIIRLLRDHGGQIFLQNFDSAFLRCFGMPCRPAQFNFSSLSSLLQALPDYFSIRGRRRQRMVVLNCEDEGSPFPIEDASSLSAVDDEAEAKGSEHLTQALRQMSVQEPELIQVRNSPVDLLSQPIPSGVPSPEIAPELNSMDDCDLMGFESPIPALSSMMAVMTDNERQQLKTPPLCQQPAFLPLPNATAFSTAATSSSIDTSSSFIHQPSTSCGASLPFIPSSSYHHESFTPLPPPPSWLPQPLISSPQGGNHHHLRHVFNAPSSSGYASLGSEMVHYRSVSEPSPQTSTPSHSPASSGSHQASFVLCSGGDLSNVTTTADQSGGSSSLLDESRGNFSTSSETTTPTNTPQRQQGRSRIAAHFSVPLDPHTQ